MDDDGPDDGDDPCDDPFKKFKVGKFFMKSAKPDSHHNMQDIAVISFKLDSFKTVS
jgi:hypothetical protein|tara:strand:+ start:449 stop:616 length:168 start_codon:yes stop_codon:yes gene_type:complete